jgi:lysozyme
MQISQRGIELIKSFEGLELVGYRCPAGIPTVGYGHTGPEVRVGKAITTDEAEALLVKDLRRFQEGVRAMAGKCTQGQYDAMCSFAFNLGLASLLKSTLLKRHREGDHARAADEFLKWNKARVNRNLVALPGLTRRRVAERHLYLSA